MTTKKNVASRGQDGAASKQGVKRDHGKAPSNRSTKTCIPIDEQYAIGADAHSWHVMERRRYKGGCRWELVTWHTTLEQCVNALADRAVRTCGAQTIPDLLAESKRLTSALCGPLRSRYTMEVVR
jgi:hypothetical protein